VIESCSRLAKLAVNNGSGDGGSCFGIEVGKLANMVIARFGDI